MSNNQNNLNESLFLNEVYEQLRNMEDKLDSITESLVEPIAIIGMSCRFPGANNPNAFWGILRDGIDTASDVPSERWDIEKYYDPYPGKPGKMYIKQGCFINNIDTFYPEVYGISGREAELMDPQQRLLLDVTWEALESAAIAPQSLKGSLTGVYMGIMTQDYFQLTHSLSQDPFYIGTGTALSIASGRISYVFGLEGPTMTVDTACSSSLVAVHLACQNLRTKECNLALVGGVNLQLSPLTTSLECAGNMLSPTGKCKTFDDSADGFLRGDGCGVLVLKRLSDAKRDNDNILALIKGSAINHDGSSGGLTIPNGNAQEKVIKQALKNAKIAPQQISLIEAHGTGTQLGDPIELNALAAIFNGKRSEHVPLYIGSVKTNIGHTEAAAGIAGMIKIILAMQHQQVPPHLNFKKPNRHIDWEEMPFKINLSPTFWETNNTTRIASVSSFGLSGTNAHVILSEHKNLEEKINNHNECSSHLMIISAIDSACLKQSLKDLYHYIQQGENISLHDLCYSLAIGRNYFPSRKFIIAKNKADILQYLEAELNALSSTSDKERYNLNTHDIIFVFDNVKRDSLNLYSSLYNYAEFFRNNLDLCINILTKFDHSFPTADKFLRQSIIIADAHKIMFNLVLQYALAKYLINLNIIPSRLQGAGFGEYIALAVANLLPLETCLNLMRCQILAHAEPSYQNIIKDATFQISSYSLLLNSFKQFADPDLKSPQLWLQTRNLRTEKITDDSLRHSNNELYLDLGFLKLNDDSIGSQEEELLAELLGNIWQAGHEIDWKQYYCSKSYKRIDLPKSVFPKKRYWFTEEQHLNDAKVHANNFFSTNFTDARDHAHFYEMTLTSDYPTFIQHQLFDQVTVPGAFYLSLIIEAYLKNQPHKEIMLANIMFHQSLIMSKDVDYTLQLCLEPMTMEKQAYNVFLHAKTLGSESWRQHCTAKVSSTKNNALQKILIDKEGIIKNATRIISLQQFLDQKNKEGLQLGQGFQLLKNAWVNGAEVLAELHFKQENYAHDINLKYIPEVLDSCLQTVSCIPLTTTNTEESFIPYSIGKLIIIKPFEAHMFCYTKLETENSDLELVYNLQLVNSSNEIILQADKLTYRKIKNQIIEKHLSVNNQQDSKTPITVEASRADTSKIYYQLAKLPDELRVKKIEAYLIEKTAELLKIEKNTIYADKFFDEMGMDSLTSIEYREEINSNLNIDLPVTLIFEYPNISSLASFINQEIIKNTNMDIKNIIETNSLPQRHENELSNLSEKELLALLQEGLSDLKNTVDQ